MIRKILTKLNYKELSNNKYYYEFQYNLKRYFVFREDTLKLFSLERFMVIEPIELITEFWVDSPKAELLSVESKSKILDSLEDTPINTVIGVYLRLINLAKAKSINDDIDDYIIDQLTSLEVIGKTFFISKYGLSIMTKETQDSKIPNGIILFSKFNVNYYGYPNLSIPKAGGNRDQSNENLLTHLMFNPVTLVDIYNKTYNHYNSSFYISTNIKETDLREINTDITKIKIHLRPTAFELTSYLCFIEKIYSANGIHFLVEKTCKSELTIKMYVTNYANIRNNYIKRLNENFGDNESIFRIKLLKKNVIIDEEKKDYVEFSFTNIPVYILSFIKVFMLEFFENIYDLMEFTHLYYEDEFSLTIEEKVPTPEELFNMAHKNKEEDIFERFDDGFEEY